MHETSPTLHGDTADLHHGMIYFTPDKNNPASGNSRLSFVCSYA
uniref:Uncharacterized protein n=1 Tax=Rhizobium rhizogenes TaxID=359 RepID=A0A7S4ZTJ7_RHIRH|nr:hypothetical protein pC5.8d_701 [Rhizobium rhizogenes]